MDMAAAAMVFGQIVLPITSFLTIPTAMTAMPASRPVLTPPVILTATERLAAINTVRPVPGLLAKMTILLLIIATPMVMELAILACRPPLASLAGVHPSAIQSRRFVRALGVILPLADII